MFIYNKMLLHIKINLIFCLIINLFVTQFSFKFHVRQVSFSYYHHNKIFYKSALFIYIYSYIYIYIFIYLFISHSEKKIVKWPNTELLARK